MPIFTMIEQPGPPEGYYMAVTAAWNEWNITGIDVTDAIYDDSGQQFPGATLAIDTNGNFCLIDVQAQRGAVFEAPAGGL